MSDWTTDARAKSYEEILLDFVTRVDRHRGGRLACELHLSLLRPYHQQAHHLRIVRKTLEPLVRRYDAGIYEMHNHSMIVATKGAGTGDIEPYIAQVRTLFAEDPLFSDGQKGAESFCTWFDLEHDYSALLSRARALNEQRKSAPDGREKPDQGGRPGFAAIRPTHLEQIERAIEHADL